MQILAINGSHRGERGHTAFLIDRLFEGARAAGATCEVATLANLKINRCLNCDRCQPAVGSLAGGPRPPCVWETKDDVHAVFQQMAAADLVIYATPIYVFNMSGLLKTFLDRFYGISAAADLRVTRAGLMFHEVDPILSKPFVDLICCDNLENETPQTVRSYFRTFSRFLDAPQVGELVRNAGVLTGHGHDPEAEARFPKIKEVYAAYGQAGQELATLGRIQPGTQRRANQEILPVPFFGWLKQVPFRAVKEKFVEQASLMRKR
jgi:NAD(P)H-dependent FMN reductase